MEKSGVQISITKPKHFGSLHPLDRILLKKSIVFIIKSSKVIVNIIVGVCHRVLHFKVSNVMLSVVNINIQGSHAFDSLIKQGVFCTVNKVGKDMQRRGVRSKIPSIRDCFMAIFILKPIVIKSEDSTLFVANKASIQQKDSMIRKSTGEMVITVRLKEGDPLQISQEPV